MATTNLTLKDRSDTNVIFEPQQVNGETVSYVNRDETAQRLFKHVDFTLLLASGNRRTNRLVIDLVDPREIVDSNGITTVPFQKFKLEVLVPPTFSEDDRKDLGAYLASLAETAQFKAALEQLKSSYLV